MAENFRGGSLVDWRLALEAKQHDLAAQLYEVTDPYKILEQRGLPTPLHLAYDSVSTFLLDPETQLGLLESSGVSNFYVGLRPKAPGLEKYRELGLAHSEVEPYVREHANGNEDNYYLRVAEYSPAEYGAIMIINASGTLRLEMVQGEMSNLATGMQTPEFTAWSDPTGVLHYSFEDTKLRVKVWQALSTTGRQPGYYEFVLCRRGGNLTPVFFDYKTNPIYSLPE